MNVDKKEIRSINVFIKFDPVLEPITGQGEMKVVMSDDTPFTFFLHSIFTSYPELQKRYSPGKLAISLNDRTPTEYDILHDGDLVTFFI
jgi:hypothetical protein